MGRIRKSLRRVEISAFRNRALLDYLYASSVLPVMGRMPRFASRDQKPDTHRVAQFGDASLRHVIPVASYFVVCSGSECSRAKPAHEPLQQLFVIATSPYVRGSDLLPVPRSEEHTSELQSPMYLVCRL